MNIDTTAELLALLQIVLAAAIVGLPALGLTIRLGLKPLVDAVVRLRELSSPRADAELRALHAEVAQLRATVARLTEQQRFTTDLLGAPPPEPSVDPSSSPDPTP